MTSFSFLTFRLDKVRYLSWKIFFKIIIYMNPKKAIRKNKKTNKICINDNMCLWLQFSDSAQNLRILTKHLNDVQKTVITSSESVWLCI